MKRNALAVVSFVAAVLAAGCGKHGDGQGVGQMATAQPAGFEPAAETVRNASDSTRELIGPPNDSRGMASADSLPPDISVSEPDSLFLPGAAVQIIARGTPDVTEALLWDGLGQKKPMTYDPEAKVWRAFYRVPLHFTQDRLSLSVTAKNAVNKWRRVWVSLKIDLETTRTKPEPASGQ